jgi:hypothetical protein
MKTALTLALLAACGAPLAAQDCAKSKTEACSAAPARTSPFLEASRALLKPENKEQPPAEAAPKTAARANTGTRPAEKAAGQPPAAGPSAEQPAPEAPQTPAPERSNPLWTLPALALLAGIYFYLQGGLPGRRK